MRLLKRSKMPLRGRFRRLLRRLFSYLLRPAFPLSGIFVPLAKRLRITIPQRPYLLEDAPGSFSLVAFVNVVMLISIILLWVQLSLPLFRNAASMFSEFKAVSGVAGGERVVSSKIISGQPVGPMMPVEMPTPTPTLALTPIVLPFAVAVTPTPAVAPAATPTPAVAPAVTPTPAVTSAVVPTPAVLSVFRFSYYWPPLGGANCARYEGGNCASPTASGVPWSEVVGEAIAVPSHLWDVYQGATFVVLSPPVLAGPWRALDVCPACSSPDGIHWLDFLLPEMPPGVSWGTPVVGYWLLPGEGQEAPHFSPPPPRENPRVGGVRQPR